MQPTKPVEQPDMWFVLVKGEPGLAKREASTTVWNVKTPYGQSRRREDELFFVAETYLNLHPSVLLGYFVSETLAALIGQNHELVNRIAELERIVRNHGTYLPTDAVDKRNHRTS